MPVPSFELTRLDERSFEHLANALALRVLGAGHTGFGPGSDGGRDGFFQGTAPYPSKAEQWDGTWYLQAKFHAPHLSKDPQKWLLDRISEEIAAFRDPQKRRKWPNNWIIVTNIEPSGVPETGCFDKAKKLVAKENPRLADRFDIWGGRKVLDLLSQQPETSAYYREFLTPGHVLQKLIDKLENGGRTTDLFRFLVYAEFEENQFTRLEQAGSESDVRPGMHQIFVDLPYSCTLPLQDRDEISLHGMAAADLALASERDQRCTLNYEQADWQAWERDPKRARVWFIKGGPGQGKSTISQYFCQVQRAALILTSSTTRVAPRVKALAKDVEKNARFKTIWPHFPRIPLSIELKEFAFWYGEQANDAPRGILTYAASHISSRTGLTFTVSDLKRSLEHGRWIVVLDGLDEVPSDVKDPLAKEIAYFVNEVLIEVDSDAVVVCTSRPQGYSGQFNALMPAQVILSPLSPEQALSCAQPVLKIGRSVEEARRSSRLLQAALASPAVREIMQSPLQSHIMAVLVRDGQRPPERKWKLFTHFYTTIKRREANKNFPDKRLALLLREGDRLLKAVHNRLGFELHARAEISRGATSSISRKSLKGILIEVVSDLQDINIAETVEVLWNATTERLVLVSTPESGQDVRFDIRQFQEFFAAEYMIDPYANSFLHDRLTTLAADAHWREVMHFVLSGLIENERWQEVAIANQTLIRVDLGDDVASSNYFRELCIGARLAARLLQEGVLESDRKSRQQFRSAIEPLCSSVESWQAIVHVNAVNTRAWLINVLLDEVGRTKCADHIGAAAALCVLLQNEEEERLDICREILSESKSYQACLLVLLSRFYGQRNEPSLWVLSLVVQIFCQSDWIDLGEAAILASFQILSARRSDLTQVCINAGIPEVACDLFGKLLDRDRQFEQLEEIEAGDVSPTYGAIAFLRGPASILSPGKLSEASLQTYLPVATGMFSACFAIASFARYRDEPSFRRVLETLGCKSANARFLPSEARNLLSENLDTLQGSDVGLMLDRNLKGGVRHLTVRDEAKSVDWAAFLKAEGKLAFSMMCDRYGPYLRRSRDKEIPEGLGRVMLETCLSDSSCLQENIEAWPMVMQFESGLAAEFKRILRVVALDRVTDDSISFIENFSRLDLPEDAAVLTRMLAALVMNIKHLEFESVGTEVSINDFVNALATKLIQLAPDTSALSNLVADNSIPRRERAAALVVLTIHHSNGDMGHESHLPSFLDLWVDSEAYWYLPAIALALSRGASAHDEGTISLLGKCIARAKPDYFARMAFGPALGAWREFGNAPVQRALQLERWH